MKQIKLTKLKELPDAHDPHNIMEGHEVVGHFVDYPKVGEQFRVAFHWKTSIVQEIVDVDIFKTMNSLYKWEVVS